MKFNYHDLFTAFYQQVHPEKVAQVNELLQKYNGKEELLFERMCSKYGIDGQEFLNSLKEKQMMEDEEYNLLFPRKKKPILLILGLVFVIVCLIILFNKERIFNKNESISNIGEKINGNDSGEQNKIPSNNNNDNAVNKIITALYKEEYNKPFKTIEKLSDWILPKQQVNYKHFNEMPSRDYIKEMQGIRMDDKYYYFLNLPEDSNGKTFGLTETNFINSESASITTKLFQINENDDEVVMKKISVWTMANGQKDYSFPVPIIYYKIEINTFSKWSYIDETGKQRVKCSSYFKGNELIIERNVYDINTNERFLFDKEYYQKHVGLFKVEAKSVVTGKIMTSKVLDISKYDEEINKTPFPL